MKKTCLECGKIIEVNFTLLHSCNGIQPVCNGTQSYLNKLTNLDWGLFLWFGMVWMKISVMLVNLIEWIHSGINQCSKLNLRLVFMVLNDIVFYYIQLKSMQLIVIKWVSMNGIEQKEIVWNLQKSLKWVSPHYF